MSLSAIMSSSGYWICLFDESVARVWQRVLAGAENDGLSTEAAVRLKRRSPRNASGGRKSFHRISGCRTERVL